MNAHPTWNHLEEFAHDVAEDRAELGHHVEGCPRCARVLAGLRDEEAVLRELLSEPAPSTGVPRRRRRWRAASGVAAGLLLASLGALLFLPYRNPASPAQDRESAEQLLHRVEALSKEIARVEKEIESLEKILEFYRQAPPAGTPKPGAGAGAAGTGEKK